MSGSSVGSASAWYADGHGFDPHVRQHSFVEFGHEIISTAILSLPLIREGQMSDTGKIMQARPQGGACTPQLDKLFQNHAVFLPETELTPVILASKSEFS